MGIDTEKVGKQIVALRKLRRITQAELGERLNISFQAVSKWERGETLPDTGLLPDLANILETTIDNILTGGEMMVKFKGKITVSDMRKGIYSLKKVGEHLGKDNIIYRYAVEGINRGMNTDIEQAFSDDYIFECFVAEAIIQNIKSGFYIDLTDVRKNFHHERFRDMITNFAKKYEMR